jgi:hypothetical protein
VLQGLPPQKLTAGSNDKLSTKNHAASSKYFRPMKNDFWHQKNYFPPIKRTKNRKSTNHKFRPTQSCCKSTNKDFKPITNHAWNHTVPGAQVQKPVPQRAVVHNARASTSHAENQQGQRLRHNAERHGKNYETNDRKDNCDHDEYLSHLKFLKHQHQQDIQKPTMKASSTTCRAPFLSRPHMTKIRGIEERNIRLLIGKQRKLQAAKLIKHDAIIET